MREDENKTSRSRKNANKKVVKLFPKKRVSTIYLAGAAIILAGAMIFRLANQDESENIANKQKVEHGVADNDGTIDSLPVTKVTEEIKMPVLDEKAVSITKHFYDENATEEEQQAALIQYNNQYTKNTGIDIAAEDGKSFEVTSALDGTVIDVKEDALLGNIVEIQHDNELKTVYQSLDDVQVELGQTVTQGEVIGKAGQSVLGKDLGIHVHFEIRNNGVAVNPENAFHKTIAALKADIEKAAESSKVEENSTDTQSSIQSEGTKTDDNATVEDETKTDDNATVEDETTTDDQSSVEDATKTDGQSSVEDGTKADDKATDKSATDDSSTDSSSDSTDSQSSGQE